MPEIQTDLVVRWDGRPTNEAPTLLLLHGLTDSGAGWREAVTHWGRDYAVLIVDQRGHGESPRFTRDQLAAHPGEVMVEDAIAVLEQLGSAPVVVGHSLGGAVALTVAVRRPDLVRGVVLEDPAPRGPDDAQRDPSRGEGMVEGLRASLDAPDDDALLRLRRESHPTWPESELLVTGRAEQQMDLEYLEYGDYKPTTPWTELFAELTVPALVLTGDGPEGICVDEEVEQGLADIGNGNVTLARVEGAGHCVRREQPEEFYALVDDWLRVN
ncbi:MAG TPA: alpha/beta hydrolase [Nocardioidaceae bacterium]|nr:alpha/beta hydrolase [Nocardioidaceae bacterium]